MGKGTRSAQKDQVLRTFQDQQSAPIAMQDRSSKARKKRSSELFYSDEKN